MHLAPWVVKIGGRLCDDAPTRAAFAAACARLREPVVVVHGGGVAIGALQERFGMTPRFDAGRRLTTVAEMPLVEMALAGVNKSLVRALMASGRTAVGLSGVDGALVRCTRVEALGEVGVPAQVSTTLVEAILKAQQVPVLAPVSLGPRGEALNVNADEFACAVAQALRASHLLLLSDVDAVQVGGAPQGDVLCQDVESLIARGEAHGGMVPKLRAAKAAVEDGVGEVRIAGFHGDLSAVGGTIVRSHAQGGRRGA